MQITTDAFRGGFGRVNSLMGASSLPSCKYVVWDDNDDVVVKNSYFDEDMFRRAKLAALNSKESSLSISELHELLNTVLKDNAQLLLDISYASPLNWKELDKQLDALLDEALLQAEHQNQLRISRQNIQQARPLINGWMSHQDVNAMVALSQKRRYESPDMGKFVNRNRQ